MCSNPCWICGDADECELYKHNAKSVEDAGQLPPEELSEISTSSAAFQIEDLDIF